MNFTSPALTGYTHLLQRYLPVISDAGWMTRFNQENSPVCPLRADDRTYKALEYEHIVAHERYVPTRVGSVHDLMNALVWVTFPITKATINARHLAERHTNAKNARSRLRDGLTLFDESGVVILGGDANLRAAHRGHDWRALFVDARTRWHVDVQALVIGHGLMESLVLRPHKGLTAKALWLPGVPMFTDSTAPLDACLANHIAAADRTFVDTLLPLPIVGVPGWHADNVHRDFYTDEKVFRPLPKMRA
jgi:hypothetical protein